MAPIGGDGKVANERGSGSACRPVSGDLLAMLQIVVAAVAAAVQIGSPPPITIADLELVERPTPEAWRKFYPRAAFQALQQGAVNVRCTLDSLGAPHACISMSETPYGYGFGTAATALALQLRFKPLTRDGRPVEGATVSLPIPFDLPEPLAFIRETGPVELDVIYDPEWKAQPSEIWMSRYYPSGLAAEGGGGRAALLCRVNAKHALEACEIRQETRTGLGMGRTMLAVAPYYRIAARTADGKATVGRQVVLMSAFGEIPVRVSATDGWEVKPDPLKWSLAYPRAAAADEVGGVAVLECLHGAEPRAPCVVVGESPPGQGFGKAALMLRRKLELTPPAGSGDPLRLTVTFTPMAKSLP